MLLSAAQCWREICILRAFQSCGSCLTSGKKDPSPLSGVCFSSVQWLSRGCSQWTLCLQNCVSKTSSQRVSRSCADVAISRSRKSGMEGGLCTSAWKVFRAWFCAVPVSTTSPLAHCNVACGWAEGAQVIRNPGSQSISLVCLLIYPLCFWKLNVWDVRNQRGSFTYEQAETGCGRKSSAVNAVTYEEVCSEKKHN